MAKAKKSKKTTGKATPASSKGSVKRSQKKRLVIPKKAKLAWEGKPNPAHENRGGRYQRIEKLKKFSGKTVAAYKEKGGDPATLRQAIHAGLVSVIA